MQTFKNPECGDLILMRSRGARKSLNRWAQALLRARWAEFSHVAITLDPVHALHSMPRQGVQAIRLTDLLLTDPPQSFVVLRATRVASDPNLRSKIREGLLYYMEQPYNATFFARIGESSSYCSELAAKAYSRAGVQLTHRSPRFVLPVDIASLVKSAAFFEATYDYADELADLPPSVLTSDVVEAAREFDRHITSGYEMGLELERLMRESALEMEEVRTLSNRASDFIRGRQHELPTPPQYWNSSRRRRGRK